MRKVVVRAREGIGHVEARQVIVVPRNLDVAPLRDRQGIAERFREVAKDRRHLLRCLEEELIAVVAESFLVVYVLASADAQQDVVRLKVRLLKVMNVIRAYEGEVEVRRDRLQSPVDHLLIGDPLVLHLQVEVLGAEDVAKRGGRGASLVGLLTSETLRYFSLEAGAQPDQSAGMLSEEVLVDPRLVVEAVGVAG